MKAELRKEVRIKKDENYIVLEGIKNEIREKVENEYATETQALRDENESLRNEEKSFIEDAKDILSTVSSDDLLKVVVQVGKGSTVIREHTGWIAAPFRPTDGTFNLRDQWYNDGKPFTIGFSCLMSIEKL